jgi:hypothetical protein
MSAIKRVREWWGYELSTIRRAWAGSSKKAIERGLLVTVLVLLFRGAFGYLARKDVFGTIIICVASGVLVFLGEFLFKLLRVPSKMAAENKQTIDLQAKTYADQKQTLESLHTERVEALQAEINRLKALLDDRAKKLENKETLGTLHQRLLGRAREIRQMFDSDYCKKYADNKRDGVIDSDTDILLRAVEQFLEQEIKGASVARFRNPENFKATPVEKPDYSGMRGQMIEVATRLYDDRLYWQWATDYLKYMASNLMNIIENP